MELSSILRNSSNICQTSGGYATLLYKDPECVNELVFSPVSMDAVCKVHITGEF